MRHLGQNQQYLHGRQAQRVAGQQIGQEPRRSQIDCALARHALRHRQTRQVGRHGPGDQNDGDHRIEGSPLRLAGQDQAQTVVRQVGRQCRPPLGQARRDDPFGQQPAGQGQAGDLQLPLPGQVARTRGIADQAQAALGTGKRYRPHRALGVLNNQIQGQPASRIPPARRQNRGLAQGMNKVD